MKSAHSDKLQKFIGAEDIEVISRNMRGWYGPPVALAGVPGGVWATGDGDFIGEVRDGHANVYDYAETILARLRRGARVATRENQNKLNSGFSGLADLISEARFKKQIAPFRKQYTHTGGTAGSLWLNSPYPTGSAPSAAPDGRACTRTTTGALAMQNAASGDTLHIVGMELTHGISTSSVLVYDRLFDVIMPANSASAVTVSGVPTRYQSQTKGNADWIGGNFLFNEVSTAFTVQSHNWAGTYTDEGGNASTFPTTSNVATLAVSAMDFSPANWFIPLAAGDVGIKALTSITCSITNFTVDINFVIGHPLCWSANYAAGLVQKSQFVTTAFNMARVFDDACLSLIQPVTGTGNTNTYAGHVTLVSG